jgi:uncharacterized protein
MKRDVVSVMLVDLVNASKKHARNVNTVKITIISDIHDNIWTLRSALAAVQETDALICCGDLCSPFIVPMLAQNFNKPIHIVLGNNDGDLYRIVKNASRFPHFHVEGELFLTDLGGRKFAVNHFDNLAGEIVRSEVYDVVCFGHNHRYQVEQCGKTLAINPGTLMGYSPLDQKDVPPTFVIYDTDTDQTAGYQVLLPEVCCAQMTVADYLYQKGSGL